MGKYAEFRRIVLTGNVKKSSDEQLDWSLSKVIGRKQREALFSFVIQRQHDFLTRNEVRKDFRDDEKMMIVKKVRDFLISLSSEDSLQKAIEVSKRAKSTEEAEELMFDYLMNTLGLNEEKFNTEIEYLINNFGLESDLFDYL